MGIPYRIEEYDITINGGCLKVLNRIPDYCLDEQRTVRSNIEQQLYEVFCKYVS